MYIINMFVEMYVYVSRSMGPSFFIVDILLGSVWIPFFCYEVTQIFHTCAKELALLSVNAEIELS